MEIKKKIDRMIAYLKTHPSPRVRNTAGIVLVIAGILGPFLPILGIWMMPMGLVLLAVDFPMAHRLHQSLSNAWDAVKNRIFRKSDTRNGRY